MGTLLEKKSQRQRKISHMNDIQPILKSKENLIVCKEITLIKLKLRDNKL